MKDSLMRKVGILLSLSALLLTVGGCDSGEKAAQPEGPAAIAELSESEKEQLSLTTRTAWQTAAPKIEQAASNAQLLLHTVETLLENPTEETLAATQAQWQQTALHYQPLNFYAHLAAQQPERFRRLRHLLFQIGARPIQPGYLDSFGPYEFSGLVHDISLPLSAPILREQHGLTAEEDAALGLYAMQFILFGSEDDPRQASEFAPQTLSAEDQEQGYQEPQELPRNRRRQLLLIQAQVLAEDLQQLHKLWLPDAESSIYDVFVSLPLRQRRELLLRSARLELSQVLSELSESPVTQSEPEAQSPELTPAEAEAANNGETQISFLMARVAYLAEVTNILQIEGEVAQNLQQAHVALQKVVAGSEEAMEPAIAAMTLALDQLAAAQEAFNPRPPAEEQPETVTQP
jgi:putative iron-regulated protein